MSANGGTKQRGRIVKKGKEIKQITGPNIKRQKLAKIRRNKIKLGLLVVVVRGVVSKDLTLQHQCKIKRKTPKKKRNIHFKVSYVVGCARV